MCDYDKEQMAQVIDNLVINAKQAMSKGGRLTVKAENICIENDDHPNLKKDSYVKIDLSDTGKGIPEELIHLIFDPFFTTKTHGHGLGLATSYSIVTRHGGTIDVRSEEGKGATFTVFLPADIDAEKEVTEITTSKYVGDGTVLIMDDEEIIREILAEMLRMTGFDVIQTADGEEAIKEYKKATEKGKNISCLIFDLTIPGGMGGRESVKMIREINPSIPVFVASGYADDPAISEPQKFGFTDSVAKPFTMDKIAEMLKKNL
jgi:CheY-like chemotaxis protein